MRSALGLVGFVALVAVAAASGASFEPGAWYAALRKPPLNPPDWIFPPVWTALYLAIAVSAWWVWRRRPDAWGALGLWGVQLALNALWSYLFFGLQRPGLALVEIALLLAAIVATALAFRRVHVGAALLLVPYAAWVAFASYLNAGIWLLNR